MTAHQRLYITLYYKCPYGIALMHTGILETTICILEDGQGASRLFLEIQNVIHCFIQEFRLFSHISN
jgi:hypothetical protein